MSLISNLSVRILSLITAPRHWQSLRFDSQTERDFIKRDLGPVLRKSHPNIGILVLDDTKDKVNDWNMAMDDPESSQYVLGTAVHWYR